MTFQRAADGSPLIKPEHGGRAVKYRRVTRFIDVLDDRATLEAWQRRRLVQGIAVAPRHVLERVAAIDADAPEDRRELEWIADELLRFGGARNAAGYGSAVHELTEYADRGEPLPAWADECMRRDVAAYERRRDAMGLEPVEIELGVVHDDLGVAGTMDRIYRWDGRLVVGDTKTGSVTYGAAKIERQLATYARSRAYDYETGERTDLEVDLEVGLVVHLPARAGSCTVFEADLQRGWAGARECARVWGHRDAGVRLTPVSGGGGPTTWSRASLAVTESQ